MIRSPDRKARGTPMQPCWATGIEGTVEAFPEFAPGLRDLEGVTRVGLLFRRDRAREARLEVVLYRATRTRGGFATCAPSRPEPIGLPCVRLLAVEGARLRGEGLHTLGGTPLLDIKPCLPERDVFAVTRIGWCAAAQPDATADGRFTDTARVVC